MAMKKPVKQALEKARDSALLAVEIYNKPAVKFKSGGYIALMVIAWTALFHAIFFNTKIRPFKKVKGRFVKIEGDFKYWELSECLDKFYGSDSSDPVRKNLEFFIPLRNRIEHRSLPEIDSNIFGECQAMLLNFDELLGQHFGPSLCLRESLSFSLQLFPSAENLIEAVKRNPGSKPITDFIQTYRSTVDPGIAANSKFSFKAYLIQVSNHDNKDAIPIQFFHFDKLTEDQKRQVTHLTTTLIKEKHIPISNINLIKPSEVVKKVQEGLGNLKIARNNKEVDKFNATLHAQCWKKYKVRPDGNSKSPEKTDSKYCIYDKMHKDYGYTETWVRFLIDKLKDDTEYHSLFKQVPPKD